MVAMAGESYLLKTRQQPLQPLCQGYHMNRTSRSTSCCVVLTLVVLVAAVTAMAGLGYCIAVEQRALRGRLDILSVNLQLLKTQVNGLHELQQLKTFEAELSEESSFSDESDESDDDSDPNDPFYPDDENEHLIEHKASAGDRPVEAPLQPLQPAGGSALDSLRQLALQAAAVQDGAADGAADGVVQEAARKRREVGSGSGRAGNARLRLYHTLQTPGVAPQADPWTDHAYRAPMYAEHAPTDFVTPPRALQATTAAPITSRRSRVMDGNGKHHRHKKVGGNRQRQRLQQHSPLPHEVAQDVAQRSVEVRHGQQHGLHRQQQEQGAWRGPWRGVRSIDSGVEVEQTWRPYTPVVEGPAIAAHFAADTARHRGTHHYDDNGRLKHPTGEYADWRPSPWVKELGLERHFRLAEAGNDVVVDTPGLYLVYAQVNYANDKDENGFWVYRNGQKELLCAVSGAGSAGAAGYALPRANTCFTAGVLHLEHGDRVALRDLAGDRYRVLDHPGRSFIGLVNLQGCKLKAQGQGIGSL